MANVYLVKNKEQRVLGGHPWVFRSDIEEVQGDHAPGGVVRVMSSRHKFLGMAVYNPQSQISLRMLSRKDESINSAWIHSRVKRAVDYRRHFADLKSCRLIFAESDGLPAVIADAFGDVIVLQVLDSKKQGDLDIATRVSVQLQLTDPAAKSRDRIVKKSEKDGLYTALDVGGVWLERALAGK